MNRKRTSKLKKVIETQVAALSPYDDPVAWLKDPPPCPWTAKQIQDFQDQINSAFGAQNAYVLAWSGDKQYGDEFYIDWYANGEPKGSPETKPMLLFQSVPVNDRDYVYVYAPRFVILETLHGSQLEASWEESSWVDDPESLGGKKRIRRKKPPQFFYRVIKTIAQHERSITSNGRRPCCKRVWDAYRGICYGKYRPPADEDLAMIRSMRENLDKLGIVQRNDVPRDPKVLQLATAATQYYMSQAARQRRTAVQEMIMADPQQFMGDVIKNYGITMNATEIERTLKEGFKRSNESKEIV